jgi:proteic killer suppression protein
MIKSFKCKKTESLFNGKFIKKLPENLQRVALRKLKILDAVTLIETLKVPPGNHLEILHGDREGQHSIRINIGFVAKIFIDHERIYSGRAYAASP